MNIMELFDPAPKGYYDEKQDQNTAKKNSSRGATRLTLAHLNQLRQSYDVRKLEHEKKLKDISSQYKPPTAPLSGGLGGGI
jgi:hypothetical protein